MNYPRPLNLIFWPTFVPHFPAFGLKHFTAFGLKMLLLLFYLMKMEEKLDIEIFLENVLWLDNLFRY